MRHRSHVNRLLYGWLSRSWFMHPTAAALLSPAEFRRGRWPVLAAGALLTVSYGARIAQGQDLSMLLVYELAGEVG